MELCEPLSESQKLHFSLRLPLDTHKEHISLANLDRERSNLDHVNQNRCFHFHHPCFNAILPAERVIQHS